MNTSILLSTYIYNTLAHINKAHNLLYMYSNKINNVINS